jgi:hypothetical protein
LSVALKCIVGSYDMPANSYLGVLFVDLSVGAFVVTKGIKDGRKKMTGPLEMNGVIIWVLGTQTIF